MYISETKKAAIISVILTAIFSVSATMYFREQSHDLLSAIENADKIIESGSIDTMNDPNNFVGVDTLGMNLSRVLVQARPAYRLWKITYVGKDGISGVGRNRERIAAVRQATVEYRRLQKERQR